MASPEETGPTSTGSPSDPLRRQASSPGYLLINSSEGLTVTHGPGVIRVWQVLTGAAQV